MREFIIRASKGFTTPFDINNLIQNRMDLVCRCVSSALCIANGIRKDTTIHIFLDGPKDPPKLISFYGNKVNLKPDEKSIAEIINCALKERINYGESKEVIPGVMVGKIPFEKFLKEKEGKIYYLTRKGKDIRETAIENPVFIIGDQTGIPKKTEKLIKKLCESISIGPINIFSSHCIVIIHNELDRREWKK